MTYVPTSKANDPRRWKRRALSVPLLVLTFGVGTALLPATLLLCGALDLLSPGWKWARTRTVLAVEWIVLCELLGLAAALSLWLIYLAHRSQRRFRDQNAALQRWWTETLFRGAMRLFSLRLEVEGEARCDQGPYLLFLRHCSTIDTLLAATLIANPQRMVFRYVLKSELLWDPCLDVVGQRLTNAFVSRGSSIRSEDLERVRSLTRDLGPKEGILLYPEGTRFTPKKLERARAKLRETASPQIVAASEGLRHLLPPRRGGALALMESAPELDVVFLVHTGLEKAVRVSDFWAGAIVGQTIRARLHRVPASNIPEGEDERLQWLMQQWLELDSWLDSRLDEQQQQGAELVA